MSLITPDAGEIVVRDRIYVGGRWVAPQRAETLEVTDAASEQAMAVVCQAGVEDVDAAVRAAAAAFPAWSRTPREERAALLTALADGIEARAEEFTAVMAREIGMPVSVALGNQTRLAITDLRTAVAAMADVAWEETLGATTVVREPVGVVAAITPWNYPLHQVCAKVGAALAAGCTVVVKPSEVAPLSAFLLFDLIDGLDVPPGVLNLVSGTGPEVGEAMVSHRLVDMISFTGSTRAGTRIMQLAADGVRRVALELGGKSANVILEDADLVTAVTRGVDDCFRNSGQNCSALTRMIVPRSRLDEVESLALAQAATYRGGDLFEEATTLGALASAAQRDRVVSYIDRGVEEGARILVGGTERPEETPHGFFVRPTIFTDVRTEMTIAQEEIFGPVLCIIPVDSEEEAVAVANDSQYGLSGAVWSADVERAESVARAIRTGRVSINGAPYNPFAPFGGYKSSGVGRELGRYGIEEFLEHKAIMH
jgi:acyl-CoA reductase-like NAD-dependent aldehyde dehydrogenase